MHRLMSLSSRRNSDYRKRGFLAGIFGGGRGRRVQQQPPPPVAAEEAASAAAATADLPFTRTLPTFEELPELVRRLNTFDWNQRIVAYNDSRFAAAANGVPSNTYSMPQGALYAADNALTAALQQLCVHYLGAKPNSGVGSFPDYVQNQYKGLGQLSG